MSFSHNLDFKFQHYDFNFVIHFKCYMAKRADRRSSVSSKEDEGKAIIFVFTNTEIIKM